jgi:pyridoxamine 5'-phosphate oxidase
MNTDLSNYRKSYEKEQLLESNISENPMELFQKWFYEVDTNFEVEETNAMTISTIGLDGYPKSRVVLLKRYTYEGFIFYTNYNSEKGKAIEQNPNVCLSFFWNSAERQIIIKGKAEKIAENLSDGYFESRPRGSQLGAIVSNQSQVIENREFLENKLLNLEKEFEGKEIPRPEFWGGYIVKPVEIEFWQGRPNRLHDRIRYQLQEDYSWTINRLSP